MTDILATVVLLTAIKFALAPLILPLIALALAAGGTAYGVGTSEDAKKKAKQNLERARRSQIEADTPTTLKTMLADAQARAGSVDPSVIAAKEALDRAQANTNSFAQRNAISGAQALDASARAQATAQNAIPGIAAMQSAYNQQTYNDLNAARSAMTNDAYRRQMDARDRNLADQQFALGELGAANNNLSQSIGAGIAGLATAAQLYNPQSSDGTLTTSPTATPTPAMPNATSPTLETEVPIGVNAASATPVTNPTLAQTLRNSYYLRRRGYYNPYNFYSR